MRHIKSTSTISNLISLLVHVTNSYNVYELQVGCVRSDLRRSEHLGISSYLHDRNFPDFVMKFQPEAHDDPIAIKESKVSPSTQNQLSIKHIRLW